MISYFIKITFRNMRRHKFFSFINIIGLSVGITCFLILTMFALDELGYDMYNSKAERIYRVYISSEINGNASNTSKTAAPLGSALKAEFPEVENYTRIGYFGQHELKYNDKRFREDDIYAVDSTYFDLFTLPLISGNPETAFAAPYSIVITENAAAKYFGNEDPIGRYFIVDDTLKYNITGVMKNFPEKSHFSCNFLISLSTYHENESNNWLNAEYTTYLLFRQQIVPKEFESKMKRIIHEKVAPQAQSILKINLSEFLTKGNRYGYFLQPLSSIHLYSQSHYNIERNTEWGNVNYSSIYYIYMFFAIGTFILLIAVLNFVNLSTAKSDSRSKEVGIRKTLGSDRTKLIFQFITESVAITLFSVITALFLIDILLPQFNQFVGKNLQLNLTSYYTIPALLIFTLIVGLLSGSYPAFYLSSIQPSLILKPISGKKKSTFRSMLVILQFAISITLIIATITIKNQLDYLLNKNLGFNKDKIIVINNASLLGEGVNTFKQELLKNSKVVSSTNSSLMFQTGIPGSSFQIETAPESEFMTCQFLDVDYDFVNTYQVKMLQGRYFSQEFSTDTASVVINESAMKIFKDENPVGKILYRIKTDARGKEPYRIIGVVKNFNYESLHQVIRPLIFRISPVKQASFFLAIRVIDDQNSTINLIKESWSTFTDGKELNYSLLNENLENMYRPEIKIGQITTIFSILAIFIACLGLFGLTAFVTEKRVKEIGIRKVVGASVTEIVLLLSKQFCKWVIIANIISWPVAYFILNNWLQEFAYRINLNFWIFILSGSIALLIALLTVSFQAFKAALANPNTTLRYE